MDRYIYNTRIRHCNQKNLMPLKTWLLNFSKIVNKNIEHISHKDFLKYHYIQVLEKIKLLL